MAANNAKILKGIKMIVHFDTPRILFKKVESTN